MRLRRTQGAPTAWLVAAGIAIVFFALPLVGLLLRVPWLAVPSILTRPAVLTALALSLVVAGVATVAAVALGLPLAWLLARRVFRGQLAVRGLVTLPMVLPPVVAGVALMAAFGRRGLVGSWLAPWGLTLPFTTAGAILAAAFVAAPLFILTVEAGVRGLDPRLEGAAATLGAPRRMIMRQVVLPALRPALVAGIALAAARALGEFGATITFAGNRPGVTQTLPLATYELMQTDPDGAATLSLLLLGLSLLLVLFAWGTLGAANESGPAPR
jgi:molybdate transport system permease protein